MLIKFHVLRLIELTRIVWMRSTRLFETRDPLTPAMTHFSIPTLIHFRVLRIVRADKDCLWDNKQNFSYSLAFPQMAFYYCFIFILNNILSCSHKRTFYNVHATTYSLRRTFYIILSVAYMLHHTYYNVLAMAYFLQRTFYKTRATIVFVISSRHIHIA